jgi:hypothetical protein
LNRRGGGLGVCGVAAVDSNGNNLEAETVPWMTHGVAGIALASLLSDVGHEVPTALLPSLLISTLGAPAAALGLIEGIADGAAGVARLGGGALADDPESAGTRQLADTRLRPSCRV